VALRGRLTLLSAGIVGVVLVLAAIVAYAAVRNQLYGQVDDALRGNAAFYQRVAGRFSGGPPRAEAPPPSLGGPGGYAQVVRPNGLVLELGPPNSVADSPRAASRTPTSTACICASSPRRWVTSAPSRSPAPSTTPTASSTGCASC
jgi:hypothetical protein